MATLYLVTGAYGHLGSTVISQLRARGDRVRGLVLPEDHCMEFHDPEVEIFRGDVCDRESMRGFFDAGGSDSVVIHTAGIVSIASRYQQRVYDVNVTGTKNVIDMCRKFGAGRLVYVSSVHAIPEAPNRQPIREIHHFSPSQVEGLYAQTKAEATQAVLDAAAEGLDAVVVHPSGILGPGDAGHAHITQMVVDFLNGRLTAYVAGGYDFVDVRDVAAGILSAADKGRKGECYILSNRYFEVKEILDYAAQASGHKKIHTKLPAWFARVSAPLAEAYYKILRQPPLYTRYSLYTLQTNANFDHGKATRELQYQPRDMQRTMEDTVAFLRRQGRVRK